MENHINLPVLNMADIKTDEKASSKQIIVALETVGFMYVDNIEGVDFVKLNQACDWLFKQPIAVKDAITRQMWKPNNKNMFRGFFPIIPGEPSHKEAFEFGRDCDPNDPDVDPKNWMREPSVWPEEDGQFPFKQFLVHTFNILFKASLDILRLVAIGIGIPDNAFDELFLDKPQSTFRLIHYPPWKGEHPQAAITEDGKVVTTPDHTDTPFMTLLHTFDFDGLEVMNSQGHWQPVKSRPNGFIMNIGDVFSRMTNGRFKATRHRVLDIGRDRYSVPFFMSPSFDGDIGINWVNKFTKQGPEHVPERYGPWYLYIAKHVKKFAEYKTLPEFDY